MKKTVKMMKKKMTDQQKKEMTPNWMMMKTKGM